MIILKTVIFMFLLSILCNNRPYYMMNAEAYTNLYGTLFQSEDGNVWAVDGDHYYGSVVLIMDNKGTDNIYDDEIFAVIEK